MAQTVIGGVAPPEQETTIFDDGYKHSIIQSKYTPHTSLLSFVSGEPTLVEWYRGSNHVDEEQHSFTPDSMEVYSSCKRINNLIVKLETNRSFSFDQQRAEIGDVISGYVLFDLAPGIGDLLIKDIGDGRAGLYTVFENPEPRTYHADKCYQFEARLLAVVTEQIMQNLNAKVIEELYYQKDILLAGGNAILTKTDKDLNKELYAVRLAIVDDILANHYYNEEETIIIPNDKKDRLYDPYLAKFLSYTIPTKLAGVRQSIKLLNCNYHVDSSKMQDPITIWDMFYRNGFNHPERYKQDYFEHYRGEMLNTKTYGGIFFSKMDRCIVIHKEAANPQAYRNSGSLFPIGPTPVVPTEPGRPYQYFFSNEFYEGNGTELEQFIWKVWRDKTADKAEILRVVENYWNLTDIQKLYMGGIYLGAIKHALVENSFYT